MLLKKSLPISRFGERPFLNERKFIVFKFIIVEQSREEGEKDESNVG